VPMRRGTGFCPTEALGGESDAMGRRRSHIVFDMDEKIAGTGEPVDTPLRRECCCTNALSLTPSVGDTATATCQNPRMGNYRRFASLAKALENGWQLRHRAGGGYPGEVGQQAREKLKTGLHFSLQIDGQELSGHRKRNP